MNEFKVQSLKFKVDSSRDRRFPTRLHSNPKMLKRYDSFIIHNSSFIILLFFLLLHFQEKYL